MAKSENRQQHQRLNYERTGRHDPAREHKNRKGLGNNLGWTHGGPHHRYIDLMARISNTPKSDLVETDSGNSSPDQL